VINRFVILTIVLATLTSCNSEDAATVKPTDTKQTSQHAGHGMASTYGYSDSVNNGLIAEDTMKGSPHCAAMATVNGTHVHIEYGSPGVKGRVIWGGLVAYDKVWATGAHNATRIHFYKDVSINGTVIPKGVYGFFTIPGKGKWVVILNTNYEQHLADEYNEKEDVLRMSVQPEEHTLTQRLKYDVQKIDDSSGVITMQWEKLHIHIPFSTMK
jgi:hypothetical protein